VRALPQSDRADERAATQWRCDRGAGRRRREQESVNARIRRRPDARRRAAAAGATGLLVPPAARYGGGCRRRAHPNTERARRRFVSRPRRTVASSVFHGSCPTVPSSTQAAHARRDRLLQRAEAAGAERGSVVRFRDGGRCWA
jgi:hypothetical protein